MIKKPADLKLILTTGDTDGIGDEIVCKALLRLPVVKGVQFIIMTAPTRHNLVKRLRGQLLKEYAGKTVGSLDDALSSREHARALVVESPLHPPIWIEQSARACLEGRAGGLATGPLSKTLIRESGFSDIGHTDILARICGVEKTRVRMAFLGGKFSVVLATGHVPIRAVAKRLSYENLYETITLADQFRRILPKAKAALPIALVALNPHASDGGIIGDEESTVFKRALAEARMSRLKIDGPLVPDAAFLPNNWRNYSLYVCPYHDQGLIPFKAVHGQQSGAHVTLGLPIIRTSVDHGTAKDIFGKNKANPGSMIEAIRLALRLCRARHN